MYGRRSKSVECAAWWNALRFSTLLPAARGFAEIASSLRCSQ